MNCVHRMTSTLLLLLLGIQTVSHSQYYRSSVHESSQGQDDPKNFFNARNYQPPYRQHQHHQHYFNDPSGTATTVRYFGTQQPSPVYDTQSTEISPNVEVFRPHNVQYPHSSESSAAYRIRYNGRPPQSSEDITPPPPRNQYGPGRGIGINLREDGDMDIFIRDSKDSNRKPEVFRIPQRSIQHFRTPEDDAGSIERPPETLVVVVHRPSFGSLEFCNSTSNGIYRKDGECYQFGSVGPCGFHTQMKFYPEKGNKVFGDCDCPPDNGHVSRPLAWWRPQNRCYLLYQRGPCNYNEWLILDRNGRPRCAPRKCPQDFHENEASQEFWFLDRGKCYKTGRHHPRFCKIGQEDYNVWFPPGQNEPVCLKDMPKIALPFTRTLLATVNDLPCKPGHKKMQNGECKITAKFLYDYDY